MPAGSKESIFPFKKDKKRRKKKTGNTLSTTRISGDPACRLFKPGSKDAPISCDFGAVRPLKSQSYVVKFYLHMGHSHRYARRLNRERHLRSKIRWFTSSAIHIKYRSLLRSSSMWEPRHPPLRVDMLYIYRGFIKGFSNVVKTGQFRRNLLSHETKKKKQVTYNCFAHSKVFAMVIRHTVPRLSGLLTTGRGYHPPSLPII